MTSSSSGSGCRPLAAAEAHGAVLLAHSLRSLCAGSATVLAKLLVRLGFERSWTTAVVLADTPDISLFEAAFGSATLRQRLRRAREDPPWPSELRTRHSQIRDADSYAMAIAPEITALTARGLGATEIAALLNEEKVPTPRGGRWYPVSVRRVLDHLAELNGSEQVEERVLERA